MTDHPKPMRTIELHCISGGCGESIRISQSFVAGAWLPDVDGQASVRGWTGGRCARCARMHRFAQETR